MEIYLRRLTEDLFQPRLVGLVSTPTAVASGTAIFTPALTPSGDIGTFRFLVNFAGAIPGLTLQQFTDTTSVVGPVLSTVGTLDANAWYVFDVPVQSPFSYNIAPTSAATILLGLCHESGVMP